MKKTVSLTVAVTTALLIVSGCSKKEEPVVKTVSFANDVSPILEKHCLECHKPAGTGHIASGLMLSAEAAPEKISYDGLMKGTKYGPIVIAGNSLGSALNMLVEGRADPSIRMPHGKEPLSDEELETLKLWVDQGAMNN